MCSLDHGYEHLTNGRHQRARGVALAVLARDPRHARAHHLLSLSVWAAGDGREAIRELTRALALDPHQAGWRRELAVLHGSLHQWSKALALFRPLVRQTSDRDTILDYGTALIAAGQPRAARGVLSRLFQTRSNDAEVGCVLALALAHSGDHRHAHTVLSDVLTVAPRCMQAHTMLADLARDHGKHSVEAVHRAAVATSDPSARSLMRLAVAQWEAGDGDAVRRTRTAALKKAELTADDRSVLLYLMLFDPLTTAAEILATARSRFTRQRGSRAMAAPRRDPPIHARRNVRARFHIGYVSGEFKATPAYYFLSSLLAHHDHRRFRITCYNNTSANDARTALYRRWSDNWHDVVGWSDDELAATMSRDRLDALVDLSGHFPDNRLSIFQRRPARVQATFPNFPCSTGCPGVDYLFTDLDTSPPGTEREYSEALCRLPSGYLVYRTPVKNPSTALPWDRNGYVTFGLFQRLAKAHGGYWKLVGRILGQIPHSRLIVHHASPDLDVPNSDARRAVLRLLTPHMSDAARVAFIGPRRLRDHFEVIASVDIALDTFPYNGQTTTCECLWSGVPVLTRRSRGHVGRVGAGLLSRAGLQSWIVESPNSYVERAKRWATDAGGLRRLRRELPSRLAARGLVNTDALTRSVEAVILRL